MKPPPADLRSVPPLPPAGALAAAPVQATHWQLQLQRAGSVLAAHAPGQSPRQSAREDESRKLEACGIPIVSSEAPLANAQPIARPSVATEEPLPPHVAPARESERSPVRLHVQPMPAEGLKVWLGIDGDAALVAQRASAAVADLRRGLHIAGERIAAIVCNGVPVDRHAHSGAAPAARIPPFPSKDAP